MKRNRRFLNNLITYAIVIIAFVVCQIMIENKTMSRSMRSALVPACCYIVMAVSLNLTVGISGELSLGHAGFMAIGAFSGSVFSTWLRAVSPEMAQGLNLLLSLVIGGLFALIAGFIIGIPVLKLRGDYLAIVTLAFGEIIRNVLNMFYFSLDGATLHASFGNPNLPGKMIYNGAAGTSGIKMISTLTAGFLLVMFVLIVTLNLIHSDTGRAIMATRDNRIAAESVGINVTKYKLIAFTMSAALAGMAGALFGLNYTALQSSKFNIDTSIQILVFVVLGGIGSIRGSVISSAFLYILLEVVLRKFSFSSKYRMLVYAVLLILVMLATNTPAIKNFMTSTINRFKTGKAAHSQKTAKGGESHE